MIEVLFENDDFLVINKPINHSIHNESGDGLIEHLRQERQTTSLYPVHRLDKATSGVLLLAKTPWANAELSSQFQSRSVEKYYLAISDTKPNKKQGLIAGDMEKTRNGSWKLCRHQNNPAVTQFFSYGLGDGLRLFLLKPSTGKTHQLRVALKTLGSPIVGDTRYGSAETIDLLLHAYQLAFSFQGKDFCFNCLPDSSRYPAGIFPILKDIGNPATLPWPKLPKGLQVANGS